MSHPVISKRNENLSKFCKLIGLSKKECKGISKGYLQLSKDLAAFESPYTDKEIMRICRTEIIRILFTKLFWILEILKEKKSNE